VKELKIGWIGAVRPSRQLLRSFLMMRNFLNSIKDFLILRRPQGGRPEGRTTVDAAGISISSQTRKAGVHRTAAPTDPDW
jgi:hypothetical protein